MSCRRFVMLALHEQDALEAWQVGRWDRPVAQLLLGLRFMRYGLLLSEFCTWLCLQKRKHHC